MKKLSTKQMLKDVIKKPSQINYDELEDETLTFTVTPTITPQERKDFVETVWNIYVAPNEDGTFDYRPYLYDAAIRIMTIITYAGIELDLTKNFEKTYHIAVYTGLYARIVKGLMEHGYGKDYQELLDSTEKYVAIKTNEYNELMAIAAQNNTKDVNSTMIDLLDNLNAVLSGVRKSIENGKGNDTLETLVSKIVTGFKTIKEAGDSTKVLDAVVNTVVEEKKEDIKVQSVEKKTTTGSTLKLVEGGVKNGNRGRPKKDTGNTPEKG